MVVSTLQPARAMKQRRWSLPLFLVGVVFLVSQPLILDPLTRSAVKSIRPKPETNRSCRGAEACEPARPRFDDGPIDTALPPELAKTARSWSPEPTRVSVPATAPIDHIDSEPRTPPPVPNPFVEPRRILPPGSNSTPL